MVPANETAPSRSVVRALGIGTLVVGLALVAAAAALAVFVLTWADRLSEGGHWGFFAAIRGFFFGAMGIVVVLVVAALGIGQLWIARRQLRSTGFAGATSLAGMASGTLAPFMLLPTLLSDGRPGWLASLADNPADAALFSILASHAMAVLVVRPTAERAGKGAKPWFAALGVLAIVAVGGALAVPMDRWDARIGSALWRRTIASYREQVYEIGMRRDGGLFVVSGVGGLTAFRTSDGREVWARRMSQRVAKDHGLVFSAEGRWLAYVEGWNVHVLEGESGGIAHRLAHDNEVDSAAFASGGRVLVTALQFSDTWMLWDVESGELRGKIDTGCNALVSGGDGDLVWSMCDRVPTAWDVATAKRSRAIEVGRHKEVAVSPDGSRVVTLEGFADSPRVVRAYDATTLQELGRIEHRGGQELVGCVDGCKKWLVVGNDGVSVIGLESGRVTPLCRRATEAAAAGSVVVTEGGECRLPEQSLRTWRSTELPSD